MFFESNRLEGVKFNITNDEVVSVEDKLEKLSTKKDTGKIDENEHFAVMNVKDTENPTKE